MKEITLEETKTRLKAGVDKLANVVKVTMGGKGKNVVIKKQLFDEVQIINDGVNIANEVVLEDEVENTGAILAKHAAKNTNDEAGDGTTTTIVLLQKYLDEMMKLRSGDTRGLREEINKVIDKVISKIDETKKTITIKDILKVAKNSSLDDEIAKTVYEVIKKIGKDGVIKIEDSSTPGISFEIEEGIKVDGGFVTPYFVNNANTKKAEFKKTPVLLVNKKISTITKLMELLDEMIKGGNTSLVIFVREISDEVTGFLVANKLQGKFQSCVVKTNKFEELEAITGAKVIADDNSYELELESLGSAGSVVVGNRETIVSADDNRAKEISKVVSEFRKQIETGGLKDHEIKELKERINKIENGVATIKVGGGNDQETKEKNLKMEDAINSATSALEDGIVEGGGMCLYKISDELDDNTEAERLVKEVLQAPFKQILFNAEEDFIRTIKGYSKDKGYNVISSKWENLFTSGVIDPAKVVKSALKNSFSMGNQILTAEAGIIDERQKKDLKI